MSRQVLYKALDISVYQGNVNFKSVRDAGYNHIFIRAGYGKNNIDQNYIVNAEACYNLGISAALYWFSYALNADMAKNEADFAIAAAKKYWKTCPIAFDLEYASINYARKRGVNLTKDDVNNFAIAFLKRVKENGFRPVIYTNRDYLKNWFDLDRINREVGCNVDLWFAYYSNMEPSEVSNGIAALWQYSSKGRVQGISGNVDMNNGYVNIWKESQSNPESPIATNVNINVQNFQYATRLDGLTDQYGDLLKPDGKDGSRTQYVRRRINLRAQRALLSWKEFSTGAVVKWWQQRLNEILGINLEVDGRFGKATRDATIIFQKRFGLKADGIVGYNTIQMAFYN